jgi:hypothetical protein
VITATGQSPTGRFHTLLPSARERLVVGTKVHFKAEEAPCGKVVAGDHYVDDDGCGLVLRDEYYDCGCRRIYHEYHDGSTDVRMTRHDGKPCKAELGPDHGW